MPFVVQYFCPLEGAPFIFLQTAIGVSSRRKFMPLTVEFLKILHFS